MDFLLTYKITHSNILWNETLGNSLKLKKFNMIRKNSKLTNRLKLYIINYYPKLYLKIWYLQLYILWRRYNAFFINIILILKLNEEL